jgi:hypothetical protein
MRTQLVGIAELRTNMRRILDALTAEKDNLIVRHNTVVALLVHPDRIEALLDRIEHLEDENAVLRHQLNPEETIPLEKLMADLGAL